MVNFTLCILPKFKKRFTKKCTWIFIHNSIIYNSQKLEATCVQQEMNVLTKYATSIQGHISLKKERNSDMCYNMGKAWGYDAKLISQSQKNNYYKIPHIWST